MVVRKSSKVESPQNLKQCYKVENTFIVGIRTRPRATPLNYHMQINIKIPKAAMLKMHTIFYSSCNTDNRLLCIFKFDLDLQAQRFLEQ
jgi:hypothetical protein